MRSIHASLRERALFWLLAILLGLAAFEALAAPPAIPSGVQARARDRVDYGYNPGIVIGMVNADGRTVFAYGSHSWDDPTPAGETTVYEIGSVTKTFTGLLLAKMVESGAVQFQGKVADYLPEGTVMPGNGGDDITLEHLGSQRSGLPAGIGNLAETVVDPANPFSNYTAADMLAFLGSYTLTRAPGAQFEYSNFGIGLLGYALAQSQGVPYEALLRAQILDPLGMADTAITLEAAQEARRAPGFAGYVERPKFYMNDLEAAGGLFSTAGDLLTYVEHQLGLVKDSPLAGAMAESKMSRGGSGDPLYDIGLPWWLWKFGDIHVQHGGDTMGSTAFVGFRKSTGTGVVVLSNARAHVYSAVTDLGFHCLNAAYPLNPIAAPQPVDLAEKRAVVGDYGSEITSIGIGMARDELTLISNGLELTAYSQGDRRFIAHDTGGNVELRFVVDGEGRATQVILTQAGQDYTLDRRRRTPRLAVHRDGGEIVLSIIDGEGDETYRVERLMDGDGWMPRGETTIWDPPWREAISHAPNLFRFAYTR